MTDLARIRREMAAKSLGELLEAARVDLGVLRERVAGVQGVDVERREALAAIDDAVDNFARLSYAIERAHECRRL